MSSLVAIKRYLDHAIRDPSIFRTVSVIPPGFTPEGLRIGMVGISIRMAPARVAVLPDDLFDLFQNLVGQRTK